MTAAGLTAIGLIARQELRIALRNRWVLFYAAIFAAMTTAVSYFGLAIIEYTGFQGFARTTASLLNLVLYIVPLVAMLMTVQSFSPEGGASDQLFSEPVLRCEVVVGKLIGVSAALGVATLLGFGAPAILIARYTGTAGLASYLVLVGISLAVGVAFCAVAALLAVLARRGPRAYAIVLVAWFALVLLYDLTVLGVCFLLPEEVAERLAYWSVFFNPVDAARVATLLTTVGKEMFGAAGALLVRAVGGTGPAVALLLVSLAVWALLPTAAACLLLRRQDL